MNGLIGVTKPCRTPEMELSGEIVNCLNYFLKTYYLLCLTGFLITPEQFMVLYLEHLAVEHLKN